MLKILLPPPPSLATSELKCPQLIIYIKKCAQNHFHPSQYVKKVVHMAS